MKKLLIVCLAMIALVFASCTKDNSEAAIEQVKNAIEQKDANVLKDALNNASEMFQKLVAENPEQAKSLFTTLQNLLKENADKIKAFVGDNAAVNLGLAAFTETSADEAIENVQKLFNQKEAVEGAVEEVKDAADKTKEAIENAPEAAKEAAEKAVEDTKNKVNEKVNQEVDNAKAKANENIDKGVNDVKKKLGL